MGKQELDTNKSEQTKPKLGHFDKSITENSLRPKGNVYFYIFDDAQIFFSNTWYRFHLRIIDHWLSESLNTAIVLSFYFTYNQYNFEEKVFAFN